MCECSTYLDLANHSEDESKQVGQHGRKYTFEQKKRIRILRTGVLRDRKCLITVEHIITRRHTRVKIHDTCIKITARYSSQNKNYLEHLISTCVQNYISTRRQKNRQLFVLPAECLSIRYPSRRCKGGNEVGEKS